MEYSFQDYDHLLEQPVQFADGYALAPDRPGHGLTLSEAARAEYAAPEVRWAEVLAPQGFVVFWTVFVVFGWLGKLVVGRWYDFS